MIRTAYRVEGLLIYVPEGKGTEEDPIREVLYLYVMKSEPAGPAMRMDTMTEKLVDAGFIRLPGENGN